MVTSLDGGLTRTTPCESLSKGIVSATGNTLGALAGVGGRLRALRDTHRAIAAMEPHAAVYREQLAV